MSQENQKTIDQYEGSVETYISRAPSQVTGEFAEWIDEGLKDLLKTARIIEIGTAGGRDAKYIEDKGYKVERTDATQNFVKRLQAEGLGAKSFNIETDDFGEKYDMIYADAVLMHLPLDEERKAFRKIFAALNNSGRLVFAVRADRDGFNNGRYFYKWTEDELLKELEEVGFKATVFGQERTKYLKVIAKKEDK